jgi:hypothetical protein
LRDTLMTDDPLIMRENSNAAELRRAADEP